MKSFLTIILAILAMGIGAFLFKRYMIAPKIQFPNLELSDLDGKSISMQSYIGKPVLVNFWATWCPNCLNEMDDLNKASKILSEKGIATVLISDESIETIEKYKQQNDFQFQYLRFNGKKETLNIYSIPTTYLLDKNGNIVFTKVGEEKWDNPSIIKKLLELVK